MHCSDGTAGRRQLSTPSLGGNRLPGPCHNLSLRPTRSLMPDLPVPPPPPLNPVTRQPLTADDLAPIFPKGLIEQEVSLKAQAQPDRHGGHSGDTDGGHSWSREAQHVRAVLPPRLPGRLLQVSLERYIDIPQEILDVYKLWR